MKIQTALAFVTTLVTSVLVSAVCSFAQTDNVGTCGWGSKLFDGQQGVAPQVLAVTTNDLLGSQTLGISSGTSGCTQDGVVASSWKTAAFIDGNMNRLARDSSRGEGESLAALAALLDIDDAGRPAFYTLVHDHFAEIFPSPATTSLEVRQSLRAVLGASPVLGRYAVNV